MGSGMFGQGGGGKGTSYKVNFKLIMITNATVKH